MALGAALTNSSLLYLGWPPSPGRTQAAVTLAVISFTSWAWDTRDLQATLLHADLLVRVCLVAEAGPLASIF